MGVSSLMAEWLSRLSRKEIIGNGMSVLDLGPQDIFATREVVEKVAARHVTNYKEITNQIFKNAVGRQPVLGTQDKFYSIFGLNSYFSADMFDPSASFKIDLNKPQSPDIKFDVVTNFGTSEHVFNIGESITTTCELVKDNGLMLFVLPSFGHLNHGFYNIHPTLYYDLAEANNYQIEDIVYIDNFGVRTRAFENESGDKEFNFESLPIKLNKRRVKKAYEEEVELTRDVAINYVHNMTDTMTYKYGDEFPCLVFDYCFVAIRKSNSTKDQKFIVPSQGIYK